MLKTALRHAGPAEVSAIPARLARPASRSTPPAGGAWDSDWDSDWAWDWDWDWDWDRNCDWENAMRKIPFYFDYA